MSNQVRHAVSYGSCAAHVLLMPGYAPHRPIPHTEFGIRNLEIRNPLAPRMERSRIFFTSPALFLLTTEHGAVWWAHHRMVR
jgi:hypothetical protein